MTSCAVKLTAELQLPVQESTGRTLSFSHIEFIVRKLNHPSQPPIDMRSASLPALILDVAGVEWPPCVKRPCLPERPRALGSCSSCGDVLPHFTTASRGHVVANHGSCSRSGLRWRLPLTSPLLRHDAASQWLRPDSTLERQTARLPCGLLPSSAEPTSTCLLRRPELGTARVRPLGKRPSPNAKPDMTKRLPRDAD